jgi:hypothetical protein
MKTANSGMSARHGHERHGGHLPRLLGTCPEPAGVPSAQPGR